MKAILQLPSGLGGGAQLHAERSGKKFSVRISPAEVDALLALHRARRADAELFAPDHAGLRSLASVMELMGYTIEDDSLRQRISRMNVRFRSAVSSIPGDDAVEDLISTIRLMGYRLNVELIIDNPEDSPRVKPPRRPAKGKAKRKTASR